MNLILLFLLFIVCFCINKTKDFYLKLFLSISFIGLLVILILNNLSNFLNQILPF